ncbi:MAG: hypothetical protein NTX88_01405 [Candidatus Atribacteria bacterium]|nr:hypothetical protein [Candidatus Atribacteria bacterium]
MENEIKDDEKELKRYRFGSINITAIVAMITATVAVTSFLLSLPSYFTITLSQQEGTVLQGEVISTTVSIQGTWKDRQPVSLNASGGPAGADYAFDPQSGHSRPGFTSSFSVKTDPNTPVGRYDVIITGLGSNGEEHTNKFFLNVKPAPVTIQPGTEGSHLTSGVGQIVFPASVFDLFPTLGNLGDADDLVVDAKSTENPYSGTYCTKIIYITTRSADKGWAGVYWQFPDPASEYRLDGRNLIGTSKLSFWAKGEKGLEKVKFMVAGATTGNIVLSSTWKQYVMDLTGKDMSNIKGGFCFVVSRALNPDGGTFYLDEARYER